jgi:hypothetical protein
MNAATHGRTLGLRAQVDLTNGNPISAQTARAGNGAGSGLSARRRRVMRRAPEERAGMRLADGIDP